MIYRFFVYKDKAKGWRWNLKAKNNRIVADSAESYTTSGGAWRAIKSLMEADLLMQEKGERKS